MGNLLADVVGKHAAEMMLTEPALFAAKFDKAPWDYQASDLRKIVARGPGGKFKKRVAVVSMPRQNGKTSEAGWLSLTLALCDPEVSTIVCVALDRDSARILIEDIKRIIQSNEELLNLVDRVWALTKNSIKFKDGTSIFIKSSDGKMSRGLRPSVVVYDELAWTSDAGELFQVLSSAQAAQPNPLMIVVSTVGPVQAGPLWALFEAAAKGDPDVRLIYRDKNLSPLVTKEFLEGERRRLPPSVYMREHENTWSAGIDAFCTYEQYKTATAGGTPSLRRFDGPSSMFVDIGLVKDETSIAVAAKFDDDRIRIIKLDAMRGSKRRPLSMERIHQRILQMTVKFGVRRIKIEAPQGMMLAQTLAADLQGTSVDVSVQHPTSKTQMSLWGSLNGHLRDGTIHIPKDKMLRQQLLSLIIKQSLSGWRVIDDPSIHQDRALAVAGAAEMVTGSGMGMFEFLADWKAKLPTLPMGKSTSCLGQ